MYRVVFVVEINKVLHIVTKEQAKHHKIVGTYRLIGMWNGKTQSQIIDKTGKVIEKEYE